MVAVRFQSFCLYISRSYSNTWGKATSKIWRHYQRKVSTRQNEDSICRVKFNLIFLPLPPTQLRSLRRYAPGSHFVSILTLLISISIRDNGDAIQWASEIVVRPHWMWQIKWRTFFSTRPTSSVWNPLCLLPRICRGRSRTFVVA